MTLLTTNTAMISAVKIDKRLPAIKCEVQADYETFDWNDFPHLWIELVWHPSIDRLPMICTPRQGMN